MPWPNDVRFKRYIQQCTIPRALILRTLLRMLLHDDTVLKLTERFKSKKVEHLKNGIWHFHEAILFWITRQRLHIQRDTKYLSIFSPNAGKCGPEKLRIWTIFTQWHSQKLSIFSGQPLLILLHQKVQAFETVPNLFTKRTAWKTSSTSESYSGPCQTYLIKFFWKQLMALAIYFFKTQKTFFFG